MMTELVRFWAGLLVGDRISFHQGRGSLATREELTKLPPVVESVFRWRWTCYSIQAPVEGGRKRVRGSFLLGAVSSSSWREGFLGSICSFLPPKLWAEATYVRPKRVKWGGLIGPIQIYLKMTSLTMQNTITQSVL